MARWLAEMSGPRVAEPDAGRRSDRVLEDLLHVDAAQRRVGGEAVLRLGDAHRQPAMALGLQLREAGARRRAGPHLGRAVDAGGQRADLVPEGRGPAGYAGVHLVPEAGGHPGNDVRGVHGGDGEGARGVQRQLAEEGAGVLHLAAATEADIAELETYEERRMFLDDLELEEPGVNRLIREAYNLLQLHTYFTAGVKEVRAWTIPRGATAPQAAGVIHSDFEKGFIRAEVIGYDDYVKYRSESACREAGRLRVEGREYLVKDGDVLHFRFNV